jgi:hypothetical protein
VGSGRHGERFFSPWVFLILIGQKSMGCGSGACGAAAFYHCRFSIAD